MKNIFDVIQQKKAQALQLAKELQALELVAPMLNDGSPDLSDPLTAARAGAGVTRVTPKEWP